LTFSASIDNWLRHVEDVKHRHDSDLAPLPPDRAIDRLCELNVIEQARHVCETTIVQDAWAQGKSVAVHGWIYGLGDGRLRELGFVATGPDEVHRTYSSALAAMQRV
jgi:carbonic anhydrase